MMLVDRSRWPVLVVTSDGRGSIEDVEAWIAAFEAALEAEEPFVAVMVSEPNGAMRRRDPEAANRSMTWLRDSRPRIAAHCRGIAYVIASEDERAAAASVARNGDRLYGCPVVVLRTVGDAAAWAGRRLATPAK